MTSIRTDEQTDTSSTARGLLRVLAFYQRSVSPAFGRRCRYLPTCSEYARIAVERFGAGKGTSLTVLRLLRCRPFGARGWDPPPSAEREGGSC